MVASVYECAWGKEVLGCCSRVVRLSFHVVSQKKIGSTTIVPTPNTTRKKKIILNQAKDLQQIRLRSSEIELYLKKSTQTLSKHT